MDTYLKISPKTQGPTDLLGGVSPRTTPLTKEEQQLADRITAEAQLLPAKALTPRSQQQSVIPKAIATPSNFANLS